LETSNIDRPKEKWLAMANNRSKLFIRRVKKALHILQSKGPKEFVLRVRDFILQRMRADRTARPRQTLEYDTVPLLIKGQSTESGTIPSVMQRLKTQVLSPPARWQEPVSPVFRGRTIDAQTLSTALEQLITQEFALAVTRDDYTKVVGGVQLKVADQQTEMNQAGRAYLHLSPYFVRETLDFSGQPGVMRVTLDGQFLGYADDETFLTVLEKLVEAGTLRSVQLHHLMGWKLEYISQILNLTGDAPVNFWLHDFFSICPNYVLLRNDREYCHAPHPNSNACNLCIYGTIRPLHYQAFIDLFVRYPIRVVAPSAFALDLWHQKFPVFAGESQVVPNASLEWGEPVQKSETDRPLRVAFVGYPVLHKGWQAWLNLTDKFGKDPRYKFFHFSLDWQRSSNFEKISVAVNRQNRTAMTDALRENEIDIAFLWSICPETFSYTLYESLAAGCLIVTNPDSGNIQAVIRENSQWGVIFTDEDELLQAFRDGSVAKTFEHFNLNYRQIGKVLISR